MSPVLSTFSGASARAFGFGYNFAASAYEHIETQTIGSGTVTSVTFSSIPQTYKHLEVRSIFRSNIVAWISVRLNGDTGNNYVSHDLRGDGSAANSYYTAANNNGYAFLYNVTPATSTFGAGILSILDYASTTKNKTVRVLHGVDTNGQGNIDLSSVLWLSTAAVTSLTLVTAGSSLSQYATFSLYGVK